MRKGKRGEMKLRLDTFVQIHFRARRGWGCGVKKTSDAEESRHSPSNSFFQKKKIEKLLEERKHKGGQGCGSKQHKKGKTTNSRKKKAGTKNIVKTYRTRGEKSSQSPNGRKKNLRGPTSSPALNLV